MAELLQLPARASTDEEAAAWMARLDRGLSPDEQARLHEWLRADAKNADALLALAALWDDLDVLAELSALLPLERAAARSGARGRRGLIWAATAGLLAIAAVAGLIVHQHGSHDTIDAALPTVALTFETEIGGRKAERLPDASTVTLNTDTAVRIEYSADARDVYLERGEVYFAVAAEPERPFRVHAGGSTVEALGTAFNVKMAAGNVEVTVTEGRVKLRDRASAPPIASEELRGHGIFDVTLIEGEVALLDQAERVQDAVPQISRLGPAQLDIKLAWQRGMLIFEGEPLDVMLEEMERYTTIDFVVEDERLRGIRIGGYFRAGDVDALLIALRENFDIESERVDDTIVLRRGR